MKGLFFQFLKEKKRVLFITFCIPFLFLFVFFLYQMVKEPILYACMIYWLLWVSLWLFSYSSYEKTHQKRQEQVNTILTDWAMLPEGENLAAEQYCRMIQTLGRQMVQLDDLRQAEHQQAQAYYTLWVHQIKTPIAVLRMLLQAKDTPEHQAMQAELFRIEQYVEVALGYIRLEDGASDLCIRKMPLDGIIRRSIRKYAPQFISKKLRIVYEGTELEAFTDEKWLGFILEQLLSNAVKYTPSGEVRICVSDDLKLTVSDSGIGVAPEDLPRIFERGFTGRNGRIDEGATGLGLYLSLMAAQKLGICLQAKSRLGEGTSFILQLPKDEIGFE